MLIRDKMRPYVWTKSSNSFCQRMPMRETFHQDEISHAYGRIFLKYNSLFINNIESKKKPPN